MARITKAQIAEQAAAELKAAQQAELARLRKEKAAATRAAKKAEMQAVADAVAAAKDKMYTEQAEQAAKVERFDPKEEARKRMEQMASAVDAVLADFEMPSWKRAIAATVASLVLAAGAGWMIGTLTGMLIVSAVALTGMAWIGYVIWVLGMVIAFYVGMKIGQHVGGYIINGTIDKHIGAVKNRVLGLFKSEPITGAFVPGAV